SGLRSCCIGRVDKHGNASGRGHQLTQKLQPLCSLTGVNFLAGELTAPPGRARLATRPSLTGSSLTLKTIGIVVVALAASVVAFPMVTSTATCRRTNSATSSGNRSI